MRVFARAVQLCVAMAAIAACAPRGRRFDRTVSSKGNSPDEVTIRDVRAIMDGIRFSRVSLENVTLSEAIHWMQDNIPRNYPESAPKDSNNLGFFISARRSPGEPRVFRGTPPPMQKPVEDRVTVHLESATVPEVLDAICAQCGYIWRVGSHAVELYPEENWLEAQRIAAENRALAKKYGANR